MSKFLFVGGTNDGRRLAVLHDQETVSLPRIETAGSVRLGRGADHIGALTIGHEIFTRRMIRFPGALEASVFAEQSLSDYEVQMLLIERYKWTVLGPFT